MIGPEERDLVERDVDGELTEGERRRLRQLAESRPEIEAYERQIHEVVETIHRVGLVEAPGDLVRNVLARVRRMRRRPERARPRRPTAPARLRYALAFAAGLALGALAIGLLTGGIRGSSSRAGMSATLLPPERLGQQRIVERKSLVKGAIRAEVAVAVAPGGALVVDLQLRAPEDLEAVVAFDPTALGAAAVHRQGAPASQVRIEAGEVRLDRAGGGSFRITLDGRTDASLRLSLAGGGDALEQDLTVRASGS